MLRKTAAVLLLIGLCTPHSCDVRPIEQLVPRSDPWGMILLGIPVLAALVYVAFALLPPVGRWIRAHGAAVRGIASGLFHLVALGYLVMEYLDSRGRANVDADAWAFLVLALVWSSGLIFWSRRRGEKADQAPLVLLALVGLPVLFFFWPPSALEYGGWILTTGYLLAVLAEMRELLLLPLRNGPPPFASDRAPG
jgi:hypothetical protein